MSWKGVAVGTSIFSPLGTPKAQHMASTPTLIGAGVKANATRIPAGWSQAFMLTAGHGVNSAFMDWGDRLLRWTGKARTSLYRDVAVSTIGYWTDNGGFYHYSTGCSHAVHPTCNQSATYEDVLRLVPKHLAQKRPVDLCGGINVITGPGKPDFFACKNFQVYSPREPDQPNDAFSSYRASLRALLFDPSAP